MYFCHSRCTWYVLYKKTNLFGLGSNSVEKIITNRIYRYNKSKRKLSRLKSDKTMVSEMKQTTINSTWKSSLEIRANVKRTQWLRWRSQVFKNCKPLLLHYTRRVTRSHSRGLIIIDSNQNAWKFHCQLWNGYVVTFNQVMMVI